MPRSASHEARNEMAHILIIEDNCDTRKLVELILQAIGHTVESTSDSLNGLSIAAREQPDLILMDLALPGLDGWEATRRLKVTLATRHIPVVAFTAQVTHAAIARAVDAGCAAIITKPFEIATFLHQIDVLLGPPTWCGRQRSVGIGLDEWSK